MENEQIEENESEGMRNLRESRDREKARADALEARIKDMVYTQAGVDKDSWVGQQLMQTYDGELSPEAIRQFATEKGIPLGEMGENPPAAVQQELNQQIAQQAANAQHTDALMGGGVQRDTPTDPFTEADAALAEGDIAKSIALKTQAVFGDR